MVEYVGNLNAVEVLWAFTISFVPSEIRMIRLDGDEL